MFDSGSADVRGCHPSQEWTGQWRSGYLDGMDRFLLASAYITPIRNHDPPNEGNALSFALKLRNKNRGTNQTHIAKNAATSMKAGASSFTCPVPYRYLDPRYRLAS